MVPASFDFCRANLNEASSAGTCIPSVASDIVHRGSSSSGFRSRPHHYGRPQRRHSRSTLGWVSAAHRRTTQIHTSQPTERTVDERPRIGISVRRAFRT